MRKSKAPAAALEQRQAHAADGKFPPSRSPNRPLVVSRTAQWCSTQGTGHRSSPSCHQAAPAPASRWGSWWEGRRRPGTASSAPDALRSSWLPCPLHRQLRISCDTDGTTVVGGFPTAMRGSHSHGCLAVHRHCVTRHRPRYSTAHVRCRVPKQAKKSGEQGNMT